MDTTSIIMQLVCLESLTSTYEVGLPSPAWAVEACDSWDNLLLLRSNESPFFLSNESVFFLSKESVFFWRSRTCCDILCSYICLRLFSSKQLTKVAFFCCCCDLNLHGSVDMYLCLKLQKEKLFSHRIRGPAFLSHHLAPSNMRTVGFSTN